MGSSAVKGKDTKVRLMRNGTPVAAIGLKSFSADQDAEFTRDEYLGEVQGVGDTDHKGWTGSMEFEVNSAAVADFIDALVTNNLERVNADEVTILHTIFYRDGSQKAWAYSGVQAKYGAEVPGMHDKSTEKLDWQADDRQPV